jgi:hypothetical protein
MRKKLFERTEKVHREFLSKIGQKNFNPREARAWHCKFDLQYPVFDTLIKPIELKLPHKNRDSSDRSNASVGIR